MPKPVSHYVHVAAMTDVGRTRTKNEDAFVIADLTGGALLKDASNARFDVGERGVLLAVSDGMGGAEAGEVASALVIETITRDIAHTPPSAPRDQALTRAIEHAHEVVRGEGKRAQVHMG